MNNKITIVVIGCLILLLAPFNFLSAQENSGVSVDKPVPLQSDEIRKIQKLGKAVLRARNQGRDKNKFERDRAALKTLRKELRKLKRDLQFPDGENFTVQAVPAGTPQLSDEEKAAKKAARKKERKEKRRARLNESVGKLRSMELDHRARKVESKIRKVKRKLDRVKQKPGGGNPTRIAKLDKRLAKLEKKQKRLQKKKEKRLNRKQKKKNPKPINPDTQEDLEEASRISQLANELAALQGKPESEQTDKVNELLRRSGDTEGPTTPKPITREPGFRTKAHHRYPIQ